MGIKKKRSSAHPLPPKPKPSPAPRRTTLRSAVGKNGKVKDMIMGRLHVDNLPRPILPAPHKISDPAILARVNGSWFLKGTSPCHQMEMAGDRTLEFVLVLGLDRRCPELPIWISNQLKTWCGCNTFLAVLAKRLKLTKDLFGPAVESSPGFGKNPGVLCGHFEVFVQGLLESNGVGAVYKFVWSLLEAYGKVLYEAMILTAPAKLRRSWSVVQLKGWCKALFDPRTDDAPLQNDCSRLGPWLADALRLQGQEVGRPFEFVVRERTVNDATVRECSVLQEITPIGTAQATTAGQAKQEAMSMAIATLDTFGTEAVELLYEYAEEHDIELEFSTGRQGAVWTACVHWGNEDESRVIGRALRASSMESQSAAAIIAIRNLNLSLAEFTRSGRAMVIGTPMEDNEDAYGVEIGPSGPVIVLD